MSLIKKILTEGNISDNILYHFTPKRNAIKILRNNILKTTSHDGDYISLTRNYSLGTVYGDIRFTIDADKLKNNYKIKPHLDPSYNATDKSYNYYDNQRRNEQEERVYKNITNFDKYILQIDIQIDYNSEKYENQTKQLLEEIPNNITYNFINKWKPYK